MILIGELRDRETAETALQAAESGHLVLSTMHTLDAAETLGRLVEFFPASKQPQVRSILAGVLKGVISQRLLPRAGGGRVAAVEVMVANARVQELIRENRPEDVPEAIAEGAFFQMQTLTQALIDLVAQRRGRRGDRGGRRSQPPRLHDRARARAQGEGGRGAQRGSGRTPTRPTRRALAGADTPARGLMPASVRRLRSRCSRTASRSQRCSSCSRSSGSSSPADPCSSRAGCVADGPDEPHKAQQDARGSRSTSSDARSAARARLDADERLPGTPPVDGHARQLLPRPTGGATTVTWCTKDANGSRRRPSRGAQPYTLWRYVGSDARVRRAPGRRGRRTSSSRPGVVRRQDLRREHRSAPAPTLLGAGTAARFRPGTHSYDVTACRRTA